MLISDSDKAAITAAIDEIRQTQKHYRGMATSLSVRSLAQALGCSHAAISFALRGQAITGNVGRDLASWWKLNRGNFVDAGE